MSDQSQHRFDIVGESEALKRVLGLARLVAPSDASVLIVGEEGTGKELLARAIHHLSLRKYESFVRVNCAARGGGELESQLFGHEQDASTGAVSQVGRLELADKGTLLLNDVEDLPLELQTKLLRVLQDGEFEKLGSSRAIRVNVRLISGTNGSLAERFAEGQFRTELYYRLNVFPIHLLPLRERASDIPLLVRHFVQRYARRMNKSIEIVPTETMDALARWGWPGNVRELENFIERSVIISDGPILNVPLDELERTSENPHPNVMESFQREQIVRALRQSGGVIDGPSGAAARLAMETTTLQTLMRKLEISSEGYKD